MPSHPRTQHALDPIDTRDFPPTEAAPAPTRPGQSTPRGDADRRDLDAVWLRVGVPDEPTGDRDDGPPDDSSTVSVADLEAELDGLGVEVEAVGADATDEAPDLQRVVDHYERLIAERDRAIRDGSATTAADRGPLAALRSNFREIIDGLRR